MSLWAKMEANIVTDVIICVDDGDAGAQWIADSLGGVWVRAEHPVRIAGVGMVYDEIRDAFYAPQPADGNPLWFFNETTVQWELPKPVVETIVLDPNWVQPI